MCNCIKDIEAKVLALIQEKAGESAKISDAVYQNIGLFSKEAENPTFSEVEYKLTPLKKNGTQGKTIRKTIAIFHGYCPHCGEKYQRKPASQEA